MLHAVIMAGGSGTRFWPASRRHRPKQFLPLVGEDSLLQQAYDRCRLWIEPQRIWVIAGEQHRDLVRQQLPLLPKANLLLEPVARNTAPCIGLAAVQALRVDPQASLLVLPSDHLISPAGAFRFTVEQALHCLAEDSQRLLLFGIRPHHPATGYGYIERGPQLPAFQDAHQVTAFREKPDAATAARYVASGKHLWNSGIFLWQAQSILDCLKRHEPEMHLELLTLLSVSDQDWAIQLSEVFPRLKSISIDYAVLEREAARCVVIESGFHWDDIGGWEAVGRIHGVDQEANSRRGQTCVVDTHDCIIESTPDHLVATVGVQDLIIVHTPTATLIARRHDEAGLRELVKRLAAEGLDRHL